MLREVIQDMRGKYDDIMDRSRPTLAKYPRMDASERAAQFSPFAALTGYDAIIQEAGRITGTQVDLLEDARTLLDRKQQLLLELGDAAPEISVTYFLPDDRKEGGSYRTRQGRLKQADAVRRLLILDDGTEIPLDSIIELDSSLFLMLHEVQTLYQD